MRNLISKHTGYYPTATRNPPTHVSTPIITVHRVSSPSSVTETKTAAQKKSKTTDGQALVVFEEKKEEIKKVEVQPEEVLGGHASCDSPSVE